MGWLVKMLTLASFGICTVLTSFPFCVTLPCGEPSLPFTELPLSLDDGGGLFHARFTADGGLVTTVGFSLTGVTLLVVATVRIVGSASRDCSLVNTVLPASAKLVTGVITSSATSAIATASGQS